MRNLALSTLTVVVLFWTTHNLPTKTASGENRPCHVWVVPAGGERYCLLFVPEHVAQTVVGLAL